MSYEDTRMLIQTKYACEAVQTEAQKQKETLRTFEKNNAKLFTISKQTSVRLDELRTKLNMLKFGAYDYQLEKNQECLSLGSKQYSLGSVCKKEVPVTSASKTYESHISTEREKTYTKIRQLADIRVQSKEYGYEAWITGITFSPPNSLLLTDWNRERVVCVDSNTGGITSYLQLSAQPWDIASLCGDQAAITLYDSNKILIVSNSVELSEVRSIDVKGDCRGIDSLADRIVVSFVNPGKVEVLDYYGEVLQRICAISRGSTVFMQPWYVSVAYENSEEVIVVSDYGTHTMTKLTMTGKVLQTYTDKNLKAPRGLSTAQNGHLLCSSWTHEVQVMSPSGKITTLLDKQDGIESPRTLCFVATQNILYVSCGGVTSNLLKCFLLEHAQLHNGSDDDEKK